jgi:hypothetical protein
MWLSSSRIVVALALCGSMFSACDCGTPLTKPVPSLVVNPTSAHLSNVAVAQDTPIVFTIHNDRNISVRQITASLKDADPAFVLTTSPPGEVVGGTDGTLTITVRPLTVSTIKATLVVDCESDAVPNHVEVPLVVDSADLGLPVISITPPSIVFDRVGRANVSRATATIKNIGVRDLIIDDTSFIPDVDGDTSIKLTTPLPHGQVIGAGEVVTVDLVFAPQDTDPHLGKLSVKSNDPATPIDDVPVQGQGEECPIAVATLVDDGNTGGIKPLDTVRIDGHTSHTVSPDTFINRYEWSLDQRPVGSTAVPSDPSADLTQLTTDLAGDYNVLLNVYDNNGVRSCVPAIVPIHVVPDQQLQIQLVWDSPTADLDLHLLNDGGTVFTHEGDCYFSNRQPDWFPGNPGTNPSLDHDDNRGYGPENLNIKQPAPGSKWTVLVHYWNKQTDGDAHVNATLRLFVFGQQSIELSQSFDDDQQLWRAVQITWSEDPLGQPTLTPIGTIEPFARPF